MTRAERLVKSIIERKNIAASKDLEHILKKKCASRIAKILKSH